MRRGERVEESQEPGAAQAEGIAQEELGRWRWTEATLAARRKADPVKVAIAQRLRRETTMTLAWAEGRLRMGTMTRLAHLRYWPGRSD
jgi:hypothetical protein